MLDRICRRLAVSADGALNLIILWIELGNRLGIASPSIIPQVNLYL